MSAWRRLDDACILAATDLGFRFSWTLWSFIPKLGHDCNSHPSLLCYQLPRRGICRYFGLSERASRKLQLVRTVKVPLPVCQLAWILIVYFPFQSFSKNKKNDCRSRWQAGNLEQAGRAYLLAYRNLNQMSIRQGVQSKLVYYMHHTYCLIFRRAREKSPTMVVQPIRSRPNMIAVVPKIWTKERWWVWNLSSRDDRFWNVASHGCGILWMMSRRKIFKRSFCHLLYSFVHCVVWEQPAKKER